ncbi:MAG: hypothetical protein ACYCQJ_10180 [Nitrososphaerales archaeon]
MANTAYPSVPAAVSTIITHNQPVYTCLKQKIVNFHALAVIIKPDVEKLTRKRTTINTLVVAIKRFSDNVVQDRSNLETISVALKDATISLVSNVVDVTLRPKKSEFLEVLKRIADLSSRLDESPDILKSSSLIKLVLNERDYESKIRPDLKKKNIIERESKGLSRITIHLSPDVKRDPGFSLFVSELLYQQGVNVIHSYIDEDTIVIVDKLDGPRAYDIIQREIVRAEDESTINIKHRNPKIRPSR